MTDLERKIFNSEPFFVLVGRKLGKEPTYEEILMTFAEMRFQAYHRGLTYLEMLVELWNESITVYNEEKSILEQMIWENSVGDQ